MYKKSVVIKNPTGLHARPASMFVLTAGKFVSNIWIVKDDRKVNAKSIIGLMSLAVSQGEEITIIAEGEDEDIAVKELVELILTGFDE